ncbi:DNA-binding protein [Sphaerisporangium cinnabarinum]|nr:DNA-binding protein [Sphaerisporangium cinnabarinum]
MRDRLIRTRGVSEMTGVSEGTLRWWRHKGDRGPKSFVLGERRVVVYKESDVLAWIEERYQASQKEPA